MRASVRNGGSASSVGSNIRKAVIGAAPRHASSVSRPSITGGRTARAGRAALGGVAFAD